MNARVKEYTPMRRWRQLRQTIISWVDFTGQTAFLRAALSGDITVMRMLLDKGADPNIATFTGTTRAHGRGGRELDCDADVHRIQRIVDGSREAVFRIGRRREREEFHGITAAIGAANRGSDDIACNFWSDTAPNST